MGGYNNNMERWDYGLVDADHARAYEEIAAESKQIRIITEVNVPAPDSISGVEDPFVGLHVTGTYSDIKSANRIVDDYLKLQVYRRDDD